MLRSWPIFLAQLVWIFRASAAVVAQRVTIPVPIVAEPSQTFDGNDGPFSSFDISIGTPSQTSKFFISTSLWQTLVVSKCGSKGPPACNPSQIGEFYFGNSTSWQNNNATNTNYYNTLIDPQEGITVPAWVGFDDVSLPGLGPVVKNQTIGLLSPDNSSIGFLGINPTSSTFPNGVSTTSFLQVLRDQALIPSLSWGYTAGNNYRLNGKAYASLTLGGYDASRFEPHDGSWPINQTNNNDLPLQLQSITWTSPGNPVQGLTPNPITVSLDSSLPYLWLPVPVCKLFETAFNLEWDDTAQLYLVNDSLHNALVAQQASVTFFLTGMTGGTSNNVNITLPYGAFDLEASAPLLNITGSTRYYPLKRSPDNKGVLGRTFFQEAFVVADFDRGNFSVYPCIWEASTGSQVTAIMPPTNNTGGTEPGPVEPVPKSSKSSIAGPVAGGVVGGLAVLAIIAILVYFCYWKPKHRRSLDYTTNGTVEKPPVPIEDPHRNRAELSNTQRTSGIPELEGSSAGPSHEPVASEMPVHEETASEFATESNIHEMSTPEETAETAHGFPWRRSTQEGGANSPSPLGSPGIQSVMSPVSSPSPEPPSTIPSPAPSPEPVLVHMQRYKRPEPQTINSETRLVSDRDSGSKAD